MPRESILKFLPFRGMGKNSQNRKNPKTTADKKTGGGHAQRR
jgi:hypothetical protein